jgi:hypothetical protein
LPQSQATGNEDFYSWINSLSESFGKLIVVVCQWSPFYGFALSFASSIPPQNGHCPFGQYGILVA